MRTIYFLLIILLHPLIKAESAPQYNTVIYDNTGPCQKQDKSCIPFTKFTFFKQPIEKFNQQKQAEKLNIFYQELTNYTCKAEAKVDNEGNIRIYSREPLKQNAKFFEINYNSTINSNLEQITKQKIIFPFHQYLLAHKDYTMPTFEHQSSKIYMPSLLRLIFNLWYHFSQLDSSFYKEELSSLQRIIKSPSMTMTHYEIKTFGERYRMEKEILSERKLIKKSFEFFKNELNWHLSKEQQLSLFSSNPIKLSNFVYLTRIILSAFKLSNSETFLMPSYNFIEILPLFKQKQVVKHPQMKNYLTDTKDNNLRVNLQASEDMNQSEIFHQYQLISNKEYMLIFGFTPFANRQECLMVEAVPESLAEKYKLEMIHCVNPQKVKQFLALGILDSLDEKERYKCKQATGLDELQFKEKYKQIHQFCKWSSWGLGNIYLFQFFTDIFTQPLKDLNEFQVYEMQFQDKILKYLTQRGQKKLPVTNGQLMLNYSQFFINLAKKMEKKYKEFQKNI